MAKPITKKIAFFVLLASSSTIYSLPTSWDDFFTKQNLPWLLIGATSCCIVAKIAQAVYQNKFIPHEQRIEKYRSTYKKIHQKIHHYHNLHYYDAQKSDWELKESIIENNQDTHPFIAYYAVLVKNSWILKQCLAILDKQLEKINKDVKELRTHQKTENSIQLEEKLLQMTIQGRHLQEYIIRTMTLVSILKKRIKLFREYNDDCYSWSQGKKIIYENG